MVEGRPPPAKAVAETWYQPVVRTVDVPGAARPAKTLYDVSQALSWVATGRSNTEERVNWQEAIPKLIGSLGAGAKSPARIQQ